MAVVIVTRNRLPQLLTTLDHLRALPEKPKVVVVDNASSDGTAEAVRRRHPEVEVIALTENLGGAGRNVGVKRAGTPYVAFADDDSWWAPGSLSRAADVFDAHPRLGLLAARILVGPQEKEDPVCAGMEQSPLPPEPDLPGPPVLGFLACGTIVRRSAYLDVGGFDPRFGIGGTEELLAADLASGGWGLAYVGDGVAHHHPSTVRDLGARRSGEVRNALCFALLRRPAPAVARQTLLALNSALRDAGARDGLVQALRALPWALRRRRVVPRHVEEKLRTLDRERETKRV